jgi:hypothetical protein
MGEIIKTKSGKLGHIIEAMPGLKVICDQVDDDFNLMLDDDKKPIRFCVSIINTERVGWIEPWGLK